MSEQPSENQSDNTPTSKPEVRPTLSPNNQPESRSSGGGRGFVVGIVAILLALIAIGIAYFGMRQQSTSEQAIKQSQSTLNDEINQKSDQLKNTIQSASDQALQSAKMQIDQSIQKSEAQLQQQQNQLAASLNATQAKMQELINLSGKNQAAWVLGETEYMLRLANLDLTIGGNITATVHLLKLADERLAQLSDESINPVRAAIANDLATLQAVKQTDVAGLVFKIDALNQQIENLPGTPSKMLAQNMQNTNAKPTQAAAKTWKDHMNNALDSFKSFFVIRHTDQKQAPLLEPKQVIFLKENVRLKLSQAEWAAMHQDQSLYLSSIALAEKWLNGYNEGDMNAKQEIISALDQLKTMNVKPALPNILTSLQALHQYSAAAKNQTSTQLPFNDASKTNNEAEKIMENHSADQSGTSANQDQTQTMQNDHPNSDQRNSDQGNTSQDNSNHDNSNQEGHDQSKSEHPQAETKKKNPFSGTGIHKQPLNPSVAI